jgi:hypothetical protein
VVVQLIKTKVSKKQRETDKRTKKAINFAVQQGKGVSQKMSAAALLSGKMKYQGVSSNMAAVQALLNGSKAKLPWDGLTEVVKSRKFESCAEAHLYALIISEHDNPRKYDLASFTDDGHAAPPCANCAQWVGKTFKSVLSGNAPYRRESVQSPTRHSARRERQDDRRDAHAALMQERAAQDVQARLLRQQARLEADNALVFGRALTDLFADE